MGAERENAGAPAARHFILGTAGHVDHGKTELVRALTGHDTDRLKEEKERGISIELGFAPLRLTDDIFLGIIDVPGHERFVRQMVAGAGGIDMAMLLVAADEGVMPQTTEHVEVLRSLGIQHGVVVISKADLVEPDTIPVLQAEIAELVQGTFLENAPVVEVSARAGTGIDTLRKVLLEIARAIDVRGAEGPFRLAVDRVFHQKGIGAVITGSGYSGRVRAGDELDLLPADIRVRVRGIQSFGDMRNEGLAGERLALALQGVKLEDIHRGDTLATPGRFIVTDVIDVRVVLAGEERAELVNRERVRVHHGAREVLGRVILFERDQLHHGESSLAQLRLEQAIVADAGDRMVLRSYSPARVIGGAVVIDPRARTHRRSDTAAVERLRHREAGDPADVLARAVEHAGIAGLAESELDAQLCGDLVGTGEIILVAGHAYHRNVLVQLGGKAVETALAYAARHPLQWGIDKEELRGKLGFAHSAAVFNRMIETLAATNPLFVRGSRVRGGTPDLAISRELETKVGALREQIRVAGIAFLSRDELSRVWTGTEPFAEALSLLRSRGDVIDVGAGVVQPEALQRCIVTVVAWFEKHAELSVGDFKAAVGVTRKHAIPLLEYFDQRGYTSRKGNARVAGPALEDAKKSADRGT